MADRDLRRADDLSGESMLCLERQVELEVKSDIKSDVKAEVM